MRFDYDGTGEHELICSAYTMRIYEQQFNGANIISDVFGKIDISDISVEIIGADVVKSKLAEANGGGLPTATEELIDKAFPITVPKYIDYTKDNWGNYLKALWAMLKTADVVNGRNSVLPYDSWLIHLGQIDLDAISKVVGEQLNNNLFRSRVANTDSK